MLLSFYVVNIRNTYSPKVSLNHIGTVGHIGFSM